MGNVEFFRCELCGNIVALIKKGGGTLSCCGQEMTLLKAGAVDAAKEKHVPVVTKKDGMITVSVGSVAHPMVEEHFIEWVALATDDSVIIKYLHPGEEPKTAFCEVPSGTVYAYCNLHGLWKTDF